MFNETNPVTCNQGKLLSWNWHSNDNRPESPWTLHFACYPPVDVYLVPTGERAEGEKTAGDYGKAAELGPITFICWGSTLLFSCYTSRVIGFSPRVARFFSPFSEHGEWRTLHLFPVHTIDISVFWFRWSELHMNCVKILWTVFSSSAVLLQSKKVPSSNPPFCMEFVCSFFWQNKKKREETHKALKCPAAATL